MGGPRRIDVHHHVVPPDYAALLHDKGVRPGGIPLPEWSLSLASAILRKNGVETAILSVSTPGVWFGDVPEARLWARRVNEFAAEVVQREPRRFGFFATLTLPDVIGALAEAAYAFDTLHADGVVLLANNAGIYPGDPRFDRLLGFLHERRAVVFVHPGELPAEPVPGIPSFTADFLLDTTRAAVSLVLNGALERYDGIRWILAHAGGFVPYISHRIMLTMLQAEPRWTALGAALNPKLAAEQRLDLIRRFWFDTALSSTSTAFPSLLAFADHGRTVFGSDFPFAPAPAVRYMRLEYEGLDLARQLRAGIDRDNAERLFPRLAG